VSTHPTYAEAADAETALIKEFRAWENTKFWNAGYFAEGTARVCREALLGKKHTDEHRQKIRVSNRGVKRDEITRRRMSEAASRRWQDPEQRKTLLHSLKGVRKPKRTAEHQEKIAAAHRGRTHSPETKERMRQAALRRWAKTS